MVSLNVATRQMQYYNDWLCHCGKSDKHLNTLVGGTLLNTEPVMVISIIAYVTNSSFTEQTALCNYSDKGLLGDNRC